MYLICVHSILKHPSRRMGLHPSSNKQTVCSLNGWVVLWFYKEGVATGQPRQDFVDMQIMLANICKNDKIYMCLHFMRCFKIIYVCKVNYSIYTLRNCFQLLQLSNNLVPHPHKAVSSKHCPQLLSACYMLSFFDVLRSFSSDDIRW